jgi:hypothetical protein
VTQVTRKKLPLWAWLLLFLTRGLIASAQPDPWSASHVPSAQTAAATNPPKPAEALYLQLRSVGLDPAQTFHIRGASIDRSALHVTLEDGDISFTNSVDGHVTGAYFEGDGEVLLTPPNQVERASMTLFTGMAILEERFATGYLRFNDQTFAELRPYLRPAEDAKDFSSRRNETAHNLAELDALRLLGTLSRSLPVTGDLGDSAGATAQDTSADRMLHARLYGQKLGAFDVYYDSTAAEQIWAGQARMVEGVTYYNLWTSFALSTGTAATERGRSVDQEDEVRISGYQIRAEVKPPTTLNAEARMQLSVERGGARTVFFELSRFLQVKQVEVDGRPVEFINNNAIDGTQLARRGNDLVAVVFPQSLRTGQALQLRFVYGGDVLSEAGGGLLYVGARGIWYPNRGARMSEFDLEFHYPPGWTLVATGKHVLGETGGHVPEMQAPEPSSPTGEQVGRWVTERPSSLAGFNLGKYERVAAQAGDVTVSAYAARGMEKTFPRGSEPVVTMPEIRLPHPPPEPLPRESDAPSPARNAQAVADQAARAVAFFSKRFGPYPYSSLKLTQMPGRSSQGWPGLVFLSSFSFLTPAEEAALHLDQTDKIFNHLVLPHETAHQWWGDLVGWSTYRDQWIVEALANYSALMMLQDESPSEFRRAMDRYRTDLLQKNKQDEFLRDDGPVTLGQRLNCSNFPDGYQTISYGRGTWLFHMLRYMLLDAEAKESRPGRLKSDGEEPFVRVLRKVQERYAGKEISTPDLFAVFEESLPRSLWYEGRRSLDWFVHGWVEGVALPHLSLQNVKYVPKADGIVVTGTIVQKESPEDLVTAVPVYAVIGGKPVLLGTVFADGPETVLHLSAPAGTKKVVLDADQTLLTRPK